MQKNNKIKYSFHGNVIKEFINNMSDLHKFIFSAHIGLMIFVVIIAFFLIFFGHFLRISPFLSFNIIIYLIFGGSIIFFIIKDSIRKSLAKEEIKENEEQLLRRLKENKLFNFYTNLFNFFTEKTRK